MSNNTSPSMWVRATLRSSSQRWSSWILAVGFVPLLFLFAQTAVCAEKNEHNGTLNQANTPQSLAPKIDKELKQLLKNTIANAKSFNDRFDAEVWLMQKSTVLTKFIKDPNTRLTLLKEIHSAAHEANIPPEFVLSVIEVESHFNPYAISSVGAQGLMQVMPFWKKEIGREKDNLTDMRTNLRYGCTILKYYLKKAKNSWPEALARYNGSYGKLWYPNRVMIAWDKHWR